MAAQIRGTSIPFPRTWPQVQVKSTWKLATSVLKMQLYRGNDILKLSHLRSGSSNTHLETLTSASSRHHWKWRAFSWRASQMDEHLWLLWISNRHGRQQKRSQEHRALRWYMLGNLYNTTMLLFNSPFPSRSFWKRDDKPSRQRCHLGSMRWLSS